MYLYIHVYTYTHIHIYIHIYTYIYIYVCIDESWYIYVSPYKHFNSDDTPSVRTHIYIYIYKCMHTCIYVCIFMSLCTIDTGVYICICTQNSEILLTSRQGWVLCERTCVFTGIQFTKHFIEFVLVETTQLFGCTVNVILTRQTCGHRSSRVAGSTHRALAF